MQYSLFVRSINWKTSALLILCSLFLCSSKKIAADHLVAQNYALLIAVNDYTQTDGLHNLEGPILESTQLAAVLEKYYNFKTEILQDPTKNSIEKVLLKYKAKTYHPDDQLFIFFSGHGTFDTTYLAGYFHPSDQTKIPFNAIGNMVNAIPCEHILLALDACYAGTIAQEIALSKGNRHCLPTSKEQLAFIQSQLEFPSKLLLTSGGKKVVPDPSGFARKLLSMLRHNIQSCDRILCYQDILAGLTRIHPKPYSDYLFDHQDGGFVFVAKRQKDIILTARSPASSFPSKKTNRYIYDEAENQYELVTLKNNQTWLKQNLNMDALHDHCPNEQGFDCIKNGRLYTWEAAKKACENLGDGWRLPSPEDWEYLIDQYQDVKNLYQKQIIQLSGFSDTHLKGFNTNAYYWTAKRNDKNIQEAHLMILRPNANESNHGVKGIGIRASCKCIKD